MAAADLTAVVPCLRALRYDTRQQHSAQILSDYSKRCGYFASVHASMSQLCVLSRWWAMQKPPRLPLWSLFVFTENTMTSCRPLQRILKERWMKLYQQAQNQSSEQGTNHEVETRWLTITVLLCTSIQNGVEISPVTVTSLMNWKNNTIHYDTHNLSYDFNQKMLSLCQLFNTTKYYHSGLDL